MNSATTIIVGLFFGVIGMGYLVYGKKQQKGVALLCGVGLCIVPYLMSNIYLLLLAGVVLVILPFLVKY